MFVPEIGKEFLYQVSGFIFIAKAFGGVNEKEAKVTFVDLGKGRVLPFL